MAALQNLSAEQALSSKSSSSELASSSIATSRREPTVVLKVGSSSLASVDGQHPNLSTMCVLVETVCKLRRDGYRVVLVTSGAVALGCQRLHLREKPADLVTKQAVAAVGQGRLMRLYDDFFSALDQPCAQVLLTRENMAAEHHYRNAENTFLRLLEMGIVPIVNENDTVSVEELKVGDNDTLSALVASLIKSDWLFLLTDVDALYTADPRKNPDAQPIRIVEKIDELQVEIGKAGSWGTGGMATKIQAARIASAAGVRTVICKSSNLAAIQLIMEGAEDQGTQFLPANNPIKGRKRFLAHGVRTVGTLFVDHGAVQAIARHSSLFAAGIVRLEGEFPAQSAVSIRDESNGAEIARGWCSYDSEQITKLKGHSSKEFSAILGYQGSDEIVSRYNMAVLA